MTKAQFTSVIVPLQHKLYRYALSIVYDIPLAEDIVQEVFLKLWNNRDRLDRIDNKEAWCIRLTRNASYDKLKSASRRVESLNKTTYQLTTSISVEKAVEEKDLADAIKEMIEGLPEKQKEIFRLRDLPVSYTHLTLPTKA